MTEEAGQRGEGLGPSWGSHVDGRQAEEPEAVAPVAGGGQVGGTAEDPDRATLVASADDEASGVLLAGVGFLSSAGGRSAGWGHQVQKGVETLDGIPKAG